MPLYRITAVQTALNKGTRLERGMSVVVNSNYYPGPDKYYPIAGNKEINDAWMRAYGMDLDKCGFLSSYYLQADMIDNEEPSGANGKNSSLLRKVFTTLLGGG